jgi:flagellar FliJ protein
VPATPQLHAPPTDDLGVTSPPFQFRLERVRSLRERAEEHAKEELAAGLAHRLRGAALLDAATRAAGEARDLLGGTVQGGASGADLQAAQAWVERAERNRLAAELDLGRRDAEVTARRRVLAHAARDHEAIVRLRDRRRAEHDREHARREQAVLDEVALTQHRRAGRGAK